MARDGKTRFPQTNAEQEEMTVVILRFKGGGETLQKGFDTVSQALAALGPPATIHRKPALPAKGATAPSITDHVPGTDGDGATPEVVTPDGVEPEAEEVEAVEESAQSAASGARKYTKPKYDDNLKLDAGDVPFKEYCAQKQPGTDNDKYLIAAAWLTKHGGHPSFTASHLFTCFRANGWNEQVDFMQPVRLMKLKKSYFDKATGKSWKLTQVGMDAEDKIAPKPPQP